MTKQSLSQVVGRLQLDVILILCFGPLLGGILCSVDGSSSPLLDLGNENADERSWALRRVHKVQFGASRSFMASHRVKMEQLAWQRLEEFQRHRVGWPYPERYRPKAAKYLRYMTTNEWEEEFEESELHFLHLPDQPNMRIEFGTDEYGAAFCDIGVFDAEKLTMNHSEIDYNICQSNETMLPFCVLDTRKFGNYSMRRANGTYNIPSREPQCLRDFYVEARREHEYNLFKYCAKGYFFNGWDYDDPKRRHFRKDMLLYLAEGAVKCNVSDSVDASEHHLKKGYSVELVQRLAVKREFLLHGLRKFKYPNPIANWSEKRLDWDERDLNDADKRYEGQQQSDIDLSHTFLGGGSWSAAGHFVSDKVPNSAKDFHLTVVRRAQQELERLKLPVRNLADLVVEAYDGRELWAEDQFDAKVPILGDLALYLCRSLKKGDKHHDAVFAQQLMELLRINDTDQRPANYTVPDCELTLLSSRQVLGQFQTPYVHETCPDLEAVLSSYEDNDRSGQFFLGGVVGAAQLDGQWSDGPLKGKRFWDEFAYEELYPELEDKYRICYLYYHAMQRFNEWDATPLYYNLVKRWGRYDLQLRVQHHCTPRGLRETLHFDVPVGPDQAPEIHEENGLQIVLDSGELKRNTGDTVIALEKRRTSE